jgi:hypothetical protein
MPSKKVRIPAVALTAFLLLTGWIQPAVALACSSMTAGGAEGSFFAAFSGLDEGRAPMQVDHARHASAAHDASGHGMPPETPAAKSCDMTVCFQLYGPALTAQADFFTLPATPERVALFSAVRVPSPCLSALFRPPRPSTM